MLPVNHSWMEAVRLMQEYLHSSLPSPNDTIAETVNIWGETVLGFFGWLFFLVV